MNSISVISGSHPAGTFENCPFRRAGGESNQAIQKGNGAADLSPEIKDPDHRLAEAVPLVEEFPRGRLAFSVRETALSLGVSEKTVRRLIDRRLLRVSRALRHILIPRAEIERFLRQTLQAD